MIDSAAKVNQVLTWMLEGNSEQTIRAAIANEWPEENAVPLIIQAIAQMKESAETIKTTAKSWCLASTRFLYGKQVEIGEYAGAMRAIKQLNELLAEPVETKKPQQEPVAEAVKTDVEDDDWLAKHFATAARG